MRRATDERIRTRRPREARSLLLALSALGLLACAESAPREQPRAVSSLLADPTAIRAAVVAEVDEAWLPLARKLTIRRRTAELLVENDDGLARRYTIYADGRVLRRGGAQRTDAAPFDIRELQLERLPDMIAEARRRTDHAAGSVVVGRDEEDLLLFRVVPSGGGLDSYFRADGTYVEDPDDP